MLCSVRTLVIASLFVTGCFDAASVVPTDAGAEASVPDWARCSGFGSCVLAASTCCDACGEPTSADVHAVRSGTTPLAEHHAAVCPTPMTCPGCVSTPNPDLFPLCLATTCTVLDVRDQPLSACTATSDCTLVPHDCCDCGSDYTSVRVDAVQVYRASVCDPTETCMACTPPAGIEAFCAPDGHCDVRAAP